MLDETRGGLSIAAVWQIVAADPVNAGCWWPSVRPGGERFDSLGVTTGQRFDAAVQAIAHPASETEA